MANAEVTHARYELAMLLTHAADLITADESRNETVADLVGRVLRLPDDITMEQTIALLTAIRDASNEVPS